MKLYDYYRSTASYRVRITLNLKKIPIELIEVHLINHGGEQHKEEYMSLNPQALVPTLITEQGTIITQSLAMIEYLDDLYPEPPLLPNGAIEQAEIRSLALIIVSDIHPLNNLRVLNYLKHHFSANQDDINQWYHHWLRLGFNAIEPRIMEGPYCFGNKITLADVCLIPQVYNAIRYHFDLTPYPKIQYVYQNCMDLEAFLNASPEINDK